MVGNDIIDLKLAEQESNWERPRFLSKLFTTSEQKLIHESLNPFETVWLLWSMKESGYKIYMQQRGNRIFAPLKFECCIINDTHGSVTFNANIYKTISTINTDYIHTISFSEQMDAISQVSPLMDSSAKAQRYETYKLLKCSIAKQYNLDFENLEIIKTAEGIPQLYFKNSLVNSSFSMSHHGEYGSFAFLNKSGLFI